MQLKQLIQDIAEYAVKNEVVECAMGGLSLYEVNFKDNNNYPLLFISPSQNHNISNNTVTYNIMLYYIDRLLRDNENNIDIVNASVLNLSKLINIIKSFDDVLKVNNDYQINNFADTQRLTDNVAGGYVNITVTVKNTQGVCAIDAVLPNISVTKNQNKEITITENGEYIITADNGYSGLSEVNVNVNIDTDSYYNEGFNNGKIEGYNEGYTEGDINGREEQKSLLESIKITENGIYDNENGYDVVDVEIDTQSYYDNGYNEGFEEGKEEQKSLLTSINITENGNYTNENGYNEVIVNVGGDELPKLPNGISLGYSTFSSIDMSNWDWSNVYDWSLMFNDCRNLTEIHNFPSDIEILSAYNMFYDCRELTNIPQLNTSNVTDMSYMFYNCDNLTSIPELNTSNVTDMNNMFSSCTNLVTIPQLNTSNVTDMNNMFSSCINLASIPEIDTSNVTDMSYMFSFCTNLVTIPQLNTSNVTNMNYMFRSCSNLNEIKFKGNPTKLDALYLSNIFYRAGENIENPKMYYPQEFETNYQKIISQLPSNWTAIPY